jgi:hypothetical protein
MGFSPIDAMVRVDRFKHTGKWYDTFAIDMSEHYRSPDLGRALYELIKAKGVSMDGYIFVCLEPYHERSHPMLLKSHLKNLEDN